MNHPASISRHEFERSLTSEKLRPLQIVYAAMASGIAMFAAVIGLLMNGTPAQFSGDAGVLTIMSGSHAVMAAALYAVAPIIFRRLLANIDVGTGSDPATLLIGRITTAHIVRLAVFEGVAMYGLVICLLTVMWGAQPHHPELLLNGISAAIFLVFAAATFPTVDRIGNVYASHYG
jgi:F0F1-type ATP synthase membrane subunit c/vacuolar-type H+-ATPase subunit K